MSSHLPERFCSHCGDSLIPLEVPHTSSACGDCGKRRYHQRLSESGKGLMVGLGEDFHLPPDWLRMSFNPRASPGKVTRAGVPVLLKALFHKGMPQAPGDVLAALQRRREWCTEQLQRSDKFAGIDWQREGAGEEVFQRVSELRDSWEWHVYWAGCTAEMVRDALSHGKAEDAVYAALLAAAEYSLSVVTEPDFEEMLWRGYLAELAIHEVSEAAEHVPGEVAALEELDELFVSVGEATLKTWVGSGLPIGSRMGIKSLPEALVLARANWHLDRLERDRNEQAARRAEGRATWELVAKWGALALALGTALGWLGGKTL